MRLGIGLAVLCMLQAGFFFWWSEIVRPSFEQRFLRESERAKDETIRISQEAQAILAKMKTEGEWGDRTRKLWEQRLKKISGQVDEVQTQMENELERLKKGNNTAVRSWHSKTRCRQTSGQAQVQISRTSRLDRGA